MKKVICSMIVVVSIFVYGFAMAARNEPPSAPVTVVNTGDNPVPVTGSLGISGIADVNVTNTVPVSGNVGISGTADVNVTNTVPVSGNVGISGTADVNVTNTVPVINVESSTRTRFVESDSRTFNVASGSMEIQVGSVPADKLLIIEHVGVYCKGDLDDAFPGAYINSIKQSGVGTTVIAIPLLMMFQGENADGEGVWVSSQNLHLYFEGGDNPVSVGVRHKKITSTPFCFAVVSGYTVEEP